MHGGRELAVYKEKINIEITRLIFILMVALATQILECLWKSLKTCTKMDETETEQTNRKVHRCSTVSVATPPLLLLTA